MSFRRENIRCHQVQWEREIFLSRPFMPPRDEFDSYLDRLWASRYLTNNGPLHSEFEEALCRYLGVKYICLFANGTLALTFALKAFGLTGEVITSPFTSPATLQAILWNHLIPVFTDIRPDDWTMDASGIDGLITTKTSAILPVHVFGNTCEIDRISEVAAKHHLKTIYDAAPCFGVRFRGLPVCDFGDLSVLSFHATKVFHTVEGGAVICHDPAMKEHIETLKSLNHSRSSGIPCQGMNAKMNEVQCAFGLAQLTHLERVIALRKNAFEEYRMWLNRIRGVRMMRVSEVTEFNYTYLPVLIDQEQTGVTRDQIADGLMGRGIHTRKYFYPLLCDIMGLGSGAGTDVPVARKVSEQILCLPLYHDLSRDDIAFITRSLEKIVNGPKSTGL